MGTLGFRSFAGGWARAAGVLVVLGFGSDHLLAQGNPIHASVPFAAPIVLTTSQTYLTSLATADFDLDGRPDVVVVSPDLVAWYHNNGDGTFSAQKIISTALPSPTCVFAADLDEDGRPDVAVSSLVDNTIAWFKNAGGSWSDGLFAFNPGVPGANVRIVSTSAEGALAVSVAKLDGDLRPDILSTSSYDRKVAWYRNLGGGNFGWNPGAPTANQNLISTAGISPSSITVADLDRDSIRDLVVTSANDNTLAWFKGSFAGNGALQFTRFVIATDQLRASTAAVADFDGDGWLDVVCGAPHGNSVTWFRNRTPDPGASAPFFGPGQLISGIASGVFSVAAGDLDSDGRPDVAAASFLSSKVAWYQLLDVGNFGWNPGNPSANEKLIATYAPGATAVAAADFNQDGKTDIVSGSQYDGKVAIYLNLGGQCAMASSNTAPGSMLAGSRDDLLRVSVSNRGLPGDNNAKLSSLTLLLEKSTGPMMTGEANSLIESLQLFVDSNSSGSLEFGTDAAVGTAPDLSLSAGLVVVVAQGNAADLAIAPGTTRNYFVVARTAIDGAVQNPNPFRMTHVSQGASRSVISDALSSAPLTVESATNPDAPSSFVTALAPHNYADWSIIHFDASGAPGTGPTESQLSDGVANLLKYAFDADPLRTSGTSSIPQILPTGTTRQFRHRKPAWANDLTYYYEISREMLAWAPAVSGVDYTKVDTPLPNGLVQSDVLILGNWTKSYLRVRVTRP